MSKSDSMYALDSIFNSPLLGDVISNVVRARQEGAVYLMQIGISAGYEIYQANGSYHPLLPYIVLPIYVPDDHVGEDNVREVKNFIREAMEAQLSIYYQNLSQVSAISSRILGKYAKYNPGKHRWHLSNICRQGSVRQCSFITHYPQMIKVLIGQLTTLGEVTVMASRYYGEFRTTINLESPLSIYQCGKGGVTLLNTSTGWLGIHEMGVFLEGSENLNKKITLVVRPEIDDRIPLHLHSEDTIRQGIDRLCETLERGIYAHFVGNRDPLAIKLWNNR